MSSTPPQPPGEALRECLKTAVIELPVSLYLIFLSSHGHPFGEVGLDPFDMLNEFPDLSGGSSGGASAGASPYVGSPPGGGSSASSGAAAVGGGGGLLTTSPNAPAPMLASSSAKGKSRHGGGVGGATGAASAAAPAELAQITDYSPEWAWSDVSRGRRETLALPPSPSSTVLLLKLLLGPPPLCDGRPLGATPVIFQCHLIFPSSSFKIFPFGRFSLVANSTEGHHQLSSFRPHLSLSPNQC